jgi:FkbM family methyltransferase
MPDAEDWTRCAVGDAAVEVRTETDLETERATELMDESVVLGDLLDELGPDDVFYDVGANVGLYSLFAARRADAVVAFEPHPLNLDGLEANLARNGVDATVVRGALSDRGGEADLYVAAEEAGAGTHTFAPDQVSGDAITVPVHAGDELIDAGEIPPPTVAKLDVQGAEYRVLKGLENALAGGPLRTIYCELHPEQVEKIGGSVGDLTALLEDHGFRIAPLVDKADVTSNVKAVREG